MQNTRLNIFTNLHTGQTGDKGSVRGKGSELIDTVTPWWTAHMAKESL